MKTHRNDRWTVCSTTAKSKRLNPPPRTLTFSFFLSSFLLLFLSKRLELFFYCLFIHFVKKSLLRIVTFIHSFLLFYSDGIYKFVVAMVTSTLKGCSSHAHTIHFNSDYILRFTSYLFPVLN